MGDQVLITLAERLLNATRHGVTIARVGGDEFILIMVNMEASDDAASITRKILQSLSMPFKISGVLISLSTSVGISVFPQDGQNVNDLVKKADAAMCEAKEAGKNQYRFSQ